MDWEQSLLTGLPPAAVSADCCLQATAAAWWRRHRVLVTRSLLYASERYDKACCEHHSVALGSQKTAKKKK
jgi:hypothetical protein